MIVCRSCFAKDGKLLVVCKYGDTIVLNVNNNIKEVTENDKAYTLARRLLNDGILHNTRT